MSCSKVRFSDEGSAEDYIRVLNRTEKKRSVTPVRAYLCPKCLNWHVTSRRYHEEVEFEKLRELVVELRAKVKGQNVVINELNHKVKEYKDKNKELRRELGVWDSIKDL